MLARRTVMLTGLAAASPIGLAAQPAPPVVLQLQRRTLDVNGKAASVYGIMQADGTQGLTTEIGKPFRVRVDNRIDEVSLIHWHGLTPPWQQDGVPGISGPPIAAGGNADYDFPLASSGTFWMHSHQGFQEQSLMAAPLIVRDPRETAGQQEIVLMLSDFSFRSPDEIYADLRKTTAMPAMGKMSGMSGMTGMSGMAMGHKAAAPDLNDVKYDAFLANDRTLADPDVVAVETGGTVRLRVINGSSMSAFHLDLGELQGKLVAVDGSNVVPMTGRRFPIAVAQRLDIVITLPRTVRAYPVLAILEGERNQTGIILRAGQAEVRRITDQALKPSDALTLRLEAQLRAAEPLAPRKADRVHRIDLTGNMMGYVWSLNNIVWNPSTPPLAVTKGQRVELVMTNRTMMPHPMHLHGHVFQVVEIDGKRMAGAMRDTVLVPPGKRVVVAFEANNPGHWAFHCHLLYHMEAGMFATIQYT